jgi:hypothetical protein
VSVSIDKGDARITGETVIDRNSFGIGADGSGGQGSQGDIVVIKIDLLTTRLDN